MIVQSSGIARQAITRFMHELWPVPYTVSPSLLDCPVNDKDFICTVMAMQDQGLLMYEALLVGAGREPEIRGALLTRKGQVEAASLI